MLRKEMADRRRIEHQWQVFRRDPEHTVGNPNIRRDKNDSVVHRVFGEMQYDGETAWFSLCGSGWKLPSMGFILTTKEVTCERCGERLGGNKK